MCVCVCVFVCVCVCLCVSVCVCVSPTNTATGISGINEVTTVTGAFVATLCICTDLFTRNYTVRSSTFINV